MATKYILIGGNQEQVERFEGICSKIPYEEYPSGVCGHKDREKARFEAAGFCLISFSKGGYGMAAVAKFEAV